MQTDLWVRLNVLEERLDDFHIEAVASSTAASSFASEATGRLLALEAQLAELAGAPAAKHYIGACCDADDIENEVAATTSPDEVNNVVSVAGLLDDLRNFARNLVAETSRDAAEASKCVAAQVLTDRIAALEAAAATLKRESADEDVARCGHAPLAASPEAEARIMERVSECVALVDAECSLASSAGLDALRDLVLSLESVSARVLVLEGDRPLAQLAQVQELVLRVNEAEREMVVVRDSLHALWVAIRGIAREVGSIERDQGSRRAKDSAKDRAEVGHGPPEVVMSVPPLPSYRGRGNGAPW